MTSIRNHTEDINIYMNVLANKIIQDELSNEKLPETLNKIIALPSVKTRNEVLEELINKIERQIRDLFLSDPYIQAGSKKEPYPSEHPEKFYTTSIIEAVTEKLSD